jgi:hypothetical protein
LRSTRQLDRGAAQFRGTACFEAGSPHPADRLGGGFQVGRQFARGGEAEIGRRLGADMPAPVSWPDIGAAGCARVGDEIEAALADLGRECAILVAAEAAREHDGDGKRP